MGIRIGQGEVVEIEFDIVRIVGSDDVIGAEEPDRVRISVAAAIIGADRVDPTEH